VEQVFSERLRLSVNTAWTRNQTDKGFTNNDNNGASVTYAIAYIPGFLNIQPRSGVFPQPAFTYLGSNPLQTIALGRNDETVLRFTGGGTLTYQAVQSERQRLQLSAGGGIDFFSQNTQVIGPPELFFRADRLPPGYVGTL